MQDNHHLLDEKSSRFHPDTVRKLLIGGVAGTIGVVVLIAVIVVATSSGKFSY